MHEKVRSKVIELFQYIKTEIADECVSKKEPFDNYIMKITDIVTRTEESLYEIKNRKKNLWMQSY